MKIIHADKLNSERIVHCPKGGFVSNRILLESDGMGYTLTKTFIPAGDWQHWHYKNHLETCYCISGEGDIKDLKTGEIHPVYPGIVYVLNDHDDHEFRAYTDVILICVFNPPLKGAEIHKSDGSYII